LFDLGINISYSARRVQKKGKITVYKECRMDWDEFEVNMSRKSIIITKTSIACDLSYVKFTRKI
jgi:hypothetical protein